MVLNIFGGGAGDSSETKMTTTEGQRLKKRLFIRLNLSDVWCLAPFFSNISANSWQPFLEVYEARVP
jgi:hypothetical protein